MSEPQPETQKTLTLRMPASLHERARVAAFIERTSITQAILNALDKTLPALPADQPGQDPPR
jgi:predicted HicB family RNase H-like nuclease